MCGICGIIGPDRGPVDTVAGRAMAETLVHRGPDGFGEHEFSMPDPRHPLRGWLGHRRLRIVDVSDAAHQPMLSADGQVALTYNGEIYNFRELRRELESHGHRFNSSGDTEVVLRAFEQWGEDFVRHIDGMFALALWDGRTGRMLLARDRTGKKPLFYSLLGGRLTFASEIKALRATGWVDPPPDLEHIPEFLTYGYVPNPATLYRGIEQVPPASVVVYDAAGVHPPKAYWDPLDGDPVAPHRPPEAGEIAELLLRATERRMIADVPVGAFLSGGIDSSVVVALMALASSVPVRTFAIGFPDEPSFDERHHARRVAEHLGAQHTEFAVEADSVALLDRLIWHHDQPFHDSSAIPTYLVSELAREHVTVALTGDGGDEVFGGYDRFVAARVARLIPGSLARVGRRGTALLPVDHGYGGVRRRTERLLAQAGQPLSAQYQSWIAVFGEDLLAEASPGYDSRAVTASMERHQRAAAHLPELDQILYTNFRTYLPDDLSVKTDRMSMAHSLEIRSPFLDTALIERLAQLPATRKVGLRRLKPRLREALRPLLPDDIWNRRKHGFGVPVGRWFREGLSEVFEDEVLAGDARLRHVLAPGLAERLWKEQGDGQVEHGPRLWTLLTLERWLRTAELPQSPAPPSASVVSCD